MTQVKVELVYRSGWMWQVSVVDGVNVLPLEVWWCKTEAEALALAASL